MTRILNFSVQSLGAEVDLAALERAMEQNYQVTAKLRDGHKEKAAEFFGVPYEAVTDAQRKYAKTVRFGEIYGATPQDIQRICQGQKSVTTPSGPSTNPVSEDNLQIVKDTLKRVSSFSTRFKPT